MGRGGLRSTSFKKGCKGNPGGKPKNLPAVEARKIVADIKAAAREYTAEALEKVVAIMRSPKSPPASALGAATQILDRGWGKPKETVDMTQRTTLEDLVLESYKPRQKAETVDQAEPDKLH